jgi:hypothetical protein
MYIALYTGIQARLFTVQGAHCTKCAAVRCPLEQAWVQGRSQLSTVPAIFSQILEVQISSSVRCHSSWIQD